MATLKGKAVVWGVDGVTFTGFDASEPTGETSSLNFQRASDMKEIKDDIGNTVGAVFFNAQNTLRIDVVPSAASIAAAKSNMDKFLPVPGTVITVIDADSTKTDGTNSGKYLYISGELRRTPDGEAVISMELKQWVDNDVTTTVS